jgi:hypothetical protein
MAWRLQDLVVEGEIDNTTKGIVTGWIQFSDRPDRVRLCLLGDCHPDLAGWRFKIKRRRPVPPWAEPADSTPLAAEQSGHAGDITADQTLRDSDCPVDELLARIRAGEPAPHIMRKALYLEWYSSRNGRVVIQDTRLGVERIGQRAYELTEEDLQRKREENELGCAQSADLGYQVVEVSFGPEPYWPSDEEIEERFGFEALAICLDPQQGPVAEAVRRLPGVGLFQSPEPFPGLQIVDDIPDLPPLPPRHRKVRELFDPPLTPPHASQLTEQRARVELRKMELLLLPLDIHIELCPHFDPKFALEWAECSVLWADVPESLADKEEVEPVVFRSSDNCETCREELGERWRAPSDSEFDS